MRDIVVSFIVGAFLGTFGGCLVFLLLPEGSMNDALSRIAAIINDDVSSTHLADYSYLGLGPARGLLPTITYVGVRFRISEAPRGERDRAADRRSIPPQSRSARRT